MARGWGRALVLQEACNRCRRRGRGAATWRNRTVRRV